MNSRLAILLLPLALLLCLGGCSDHSHDHSHGEGADHSHGEDADHSHAEDADHSHGEGADHSHAEGAEGDSWAVTAWGEHFEIFPEIDPLIVDEAANSHTHVTHLGDFSPMTDGVVEIVLKSGGREEVFRAARPVRPGIYNVEIRPRRAGNYDLFFKIQPTSGEDEEIPGGRVRVGTVDDPGGLLLAPLGGADEGEVSFLKEQQWRTPFATAWLTEGHLNRSAQGVARVRPPAGGEAHLSAPQAGVVLARPWPFPGQRVAAGTPLLRLVPQVAVGESLARLEAEVQSLEGELRTHLTRLGRLEELLPLEAVSLRQVEEARLRRSTLDQQLSAARRDLAATQAVREGRGDAEALPLRAPFAGQVASVEASPGQAVESGDPLVQVVRTDRVWLEVALTPNDARRVAESGIRGVTVELPEGESVTFAESETRLVSVAPRMDTAGTVAVLLEVQPSPALMPGATVTALVHLAETREGLVVPTAALVDDGGITVVYLQDSGEAFTRQEVEVLLRQGERALIEGPQPGRRVVTQGGQAIRRASLLEGGQDHGHVH